MELATVLETPRLRLRQVVAEDFEPLFAHVFTDKQVMQHLSGTPLTRERALTVFKDVFDHEGSGRKPGVLELRETNEFLISDEVQQTSAGPARLAFGWPKRPRNPRVSPQSWAAMGFDFRAVGDLLNFIANQENS